jgi:hypothetical protein
MKGLPGPYWMLDPIQKTKEDFVRLNLMETNEDDRLEPLRMDTIGGVLVVTTIIANDGMKSEPFITILAAPSIASVAKPAKENGVLYDDVWEGMVLNRFKPALDTAVAHCPMIGAKEEFSWAQKLQQGIFHLLQDLQPLFLPEGELLCEEVEFESTDYPHAIFLPEVCNLLIGMCWPVDVGYQDF